MNWSAVGMFSEKDMEDAIARNPKKFIGEDGLELLERQYRIGSYIFDLLFTDRHGAKLIVEIQKGTLDRKHTYKILDYYHGFREQHPDDFIELMVIANEIPQERKKRLRSWGVEFREIPEAEFISSSSVIATAPDRGATAPQAQRRTGTDGASIDTATMKAFKLFKDQRDRFFDELHRVDDVWTGLKWKNLKPQYIRARKNWFSTFIPRSWGVPKEVSVE
jgi:hypothetical protein